MAMNRDWKRNGRRLVSTPGLLLFSLLSLFPVHRVVRAQERIFSGSVTVLETGDPVPEASVRLVDDLFRLLAHTLSDADGRWKVTVQDPATVSFVLVSAPGFSEFLGEVGDRGSGIHVGLTGTLRTDVRPPKRSQDAGSGIFGFVSDASSGQPIPDVLIRLFREEVVVGRRVSSVGGFFEFDSIPPGVYRVETEHLGFQTRGAEIVSISGMATQVVLPISSRAIPLEGIEVSVRSPALLRGLRDFERRRGFPAGEFFPREKLRDRGSVRLVDLLVGLPSIRLKRGERDRDTYVVSRGRECPIGVWIDGKVQSPGFAQLSLAQLSALDIEAVEVYKSDEIPAEFFHPLSGCVTMIVWTRGG